MKFNILNLLITIVFLGLSHNSCFPSKLLDNDFQEYNEDSAKEHFKLALHLEKSDSIKKAIMYFHYVSEFDSLNEIGKISKNKLDSIWTIEKNTFEKKISGKWRWIWSGTNWGTENSPKNCNCQKYLMFKDNEIIIYENKEEKKRLNYHIIRNIPMMNHDNFTLDINNGEKLWRLRIYQEIENAYFLSERNKNAKFFMSFRDENIIPNCVCGCPEKRYEKL